MWERTRKPEYALVLLALARSSRAGRVVERSTASVPCQDAKGAPSAREARRQGYLSVLVTTEARRLRDDGKNGRFIAAGLLFRRGIVDSDTIYLLG